MRGAIPPLPNTPSWHGAQFKEKPRDNFTLHYRSYCRVITLDCDCRIKFKPDSAT